MAEISRFFGIIIRMYYREHGLPHLHAEYQGNEAVFDLQGNITLGSVRSKTAQRLVREWIESHQSELAEDWDLARDGKELKKIAPLD